MPFFKLGDTVVHVKMAKQRRRYCCAALGPGAGNCNAAASILCDHLAPGQRRRCSAPLCEDHAVTIGKDLHYCPRHSIDAPPKQEEMFPNG